MGGVKKTILVIDDDKGISQTVKGNLELDGYDTLVADDGTTGLSLALDLRPDLVLLDLNLPDIDGITVCRTIRKSSDVPVIMLTARDSISDKVLGFECGSDDYLIKPFNYLELSARIKALLKRAGGSSEVSAPLPAPDGLALDLKARTLFVRGKEVRVTKTEFQLLELFLAYPGEVLTRDFIKQQVWRDSQLYRHSRALDVHVQRLRKKIESDPEHPEYIVTVPGVGYRLKSH